jgi:hypothetical protein
VLPPAQLRARAHAAATAADALLAATHRRAARANTRRWTTWSPGCRATRAGRPPPSACCTACSRCGPRSSRSATRSTTRTLCTSAR